MLTSSLSSYEIRFLLSKIYSLFLMTETAWDAILYVVLWSSGLTNFDMGLGGRTSILRPQERALLKFC